MSKTRKPSKQKITKEELLQRLRELLTSDDTEAAHSEADQLLIDYIGDKDIAKAFDKLEKWYG